MRRVNYLMVVSDANIAPKDIPALVNNIKGIYPSGAAAFGVNEQIQDTAPPTIVGEVRSEFDSSSAAPLEHQTRYLISSILGIAVQYFHMTPKCLNAKGTAVLQKSLSSGTPESTRRDP